MSQAPIFPPGSGSDHPTGRGIGVAVLDTGCFPHEDYQARIAAFFDMVRRRRRLMMITDTALMSAASSPGTASASKGRFCGIAPGCHLIPVKVLDKRGGGYVSDVLAGLHLILQQRDRFNIRIVNVSVGSFSGRNMSETSALVRGVEEIWDAGFVVVVAAGNMGPKRGTITTPGISRKVITVGCSDDDRVVNVMGSRMSDYSGRGPTRSCICKPDIVAPGAAITSCDNQSGCYTVKSGTSRPLLMFPVPLPCFWSRIRKCPTAM